jgi:hypothetical protein
LRNKEERFREGDEKEGTRVKDERERIETEKKEMGEKIHFFLE